MLLRGNRRQQEAAFYNSKAYVHHFQSFVQIVRSLLPEDDFVTFMEAYDEYQSTRDLQAFLISTIRLLDTPPKRQQVLISLHDVLPLVDRSNYEKTIADYQLLPSQSPPPPQSHVLPRQRTPTRPISSPAAINVGRSWTTPLPSSVASSTVDVSASWTAGHFATTPRRRTGTMGTSGEKTRKISVKRAEGESFGFSVRGGAEHSVGVYVSTVDDGSVARKGGLKPGMQIMKVNDVGFEGITTAQAVSLFQEHKKMRLHVIDQGRFPDTYAAQKRYNWIDPTGRPVSPPPQPMAMKAGEEEGRSDMRLLSDADEKKVNVVVKERQKLGISVRGGAEHGVGIYISSVAEGSVADDAGLKAGDQIIDVNGRTFLNVKNADAIRILKTESLTMMMMTIKDIGKIPHSLVKYDQTKWVYTSEVAPRTEEVPYESATMPTRGKKGDIPATQRPASYYQSSSSTESTTFKPTEQTIERKRMSTAFKHGMGTQLVLKTTQVHTARARISDQARLVLNQQQFETLAYYLDQYQSDGILIEDLADVLLHLLDTPRKVGLLTDIRQIILPKDIDKFENLVMTREVESMKRARSGSKEQYDTPPVRRRATDDAMEELPNRMSATVQVHRASAEIAEDVRKAEESSSTTVAAHKPVAETSSVSPSVTEAVNALAAAVEGEDDEDDEDEDEDEEEDEEEGKETEKEESVNEEEETTLAAVVPEPAAIFQVPSPPPSDLSEESSSEEEEGEEKVKGIVVKTEVERPLPSLHFHVPPPPPSPKIAKEREEEGKKVDVEKEEKKERKVHQVKKEEVEERVAVRRVPEMAVSADPVAPAVFRVPSPPPSDQEDSSDDEELSVRASDAKVETTERKVPQRKDPGLGVQLPGLTAAMGAEFIRSPSQHKMLHETMTERRRRINPGSETMKLKSSRSVSMDSAVTDVSIDEDDTFDGSYQDSPGTGRRKEDEKTAAQFVNVHHLASTPIREVLEPNFDEAEERERKKREEEEEEEKERKKREEDAKWRLAEEEKKRQAEEEERRKQEEEEERRRQEEEKRRKQVEEEQRRKQEEEEERRRQEEEEKRRKQEEEEQKKRQEEEEKRRNQVEEEQKRKQEEEEERRRQEEEEKRRKQEEEEQKRRQEEKRRKQVEEEERRRGEKEEKRRKEEEQRRKQEEEDQKREEEEERERLEEEERKRREEESRRRREAEEEEKKRIEEAKKEQEEAKQEKKTTVIQRKAAQEIVMEEKKTGVATRPEDLYAVPIKPKKLGGASKPAVQKESAPKVQAVAGYTGLAGSIINVLVPKTKPKLGMGVDGGENTKQKAIRIRLISPGGCASLVMPPLRLGQQILSIDRVSLKGKNHKQAVECIKEAFNGRRTEMTLTVHDDEDGGK